MKIKSLWLLLICTLFSSVSIAQIENEEIDPENFEPDIMVSLLTSKLNAFRVENGQDSLIRHDVLDQAAENQAEYMVSIKKKTLDGGSGSTKTTGKRVANFGGTEMASEVVANAATGKRGKNYTYSKVLGDLFKAMTKSKKYAAMLVDPTLFYSGVAIGFDDEKSKMYASVVVGGTDALNAGAALRKSLPVKYGKSSKGLKAYDKRDCRKCEKFTNIHELQQGLYLSQGKIWLEYNDYKKLFKLLKTNKDGLGVELIQSQQYTCATDNIVDNELVTKGILLKPMKTKKLQKVNEIEDTKKENTFRGPIAKLPKKYTKKLTNDYEMNLVLFMNKSYCKSINKAYVEDGGEKNAASMSVLPDSVTSKDPSKYKLEPEVSDLSFNVPFEMGKSRYDQSDVQPIITSLNEPKYVINDVNIIAHSSVEGDSTQNSKLQEKRAESIVQAIEGIKGEDLIGNIETSDSWDMFRKQILETSHADWADWSNEDILSELRKPGVKNELEDLLAAERFAKVTMKVTYDITGENEQPFILSLIKKMVEKDDAQRALRIQRYAIQKALKGTFDWKKLMLHEFPDDPKYVSHKLNQLFLDTYFNHKNRMYPGLSTEMDKLYEIAPNHDFVNYNRQMIVVQFNDMEDAALVKEIEGKIRGLYNTNVPAGMVDGLYMEYLFRLMELADTLDSDGPNKVVEQSLTKLKKIFKLEEATPENALKLSYLFLQNGDVTYAYNALHPFIEGKKKVPEDLLFAYISAASHFQEKMYTKEFRIALVKAKEMNEDRYCELFSGDYLSFQIFDHPLIKNEYCNTCEGFGDDE